MRSFAEKLGLVILGLAVWFAVLEAGSRWFGARPYSVTVETRGGGGPRGVSLHVRRDSGLRLMYETPTGTRLARNSRAVIRNHPTSGLAVVIETNSQGFRHRELPPKTPEDFRVLMLGDSITFASHLPTEQTIPRAIEKGLQARRPQQTARRRFEVINAGVGGIDLQNELAILLETGTAIDPDLVLVGAYLNDANESVYLEVAQLPRLLAASRFLNWLFQRFYVVRARFALDAIREDEPDSLNRERDRFLANHPVSDAPWSTDPSGFNRRILGQFHDWGFAWTERYWEKSRELYAVMKRVADDRGFQLVAVLFPVDLQIRAEILRDEPQRRFRALMNDLGIAFYDPLPMLRERFQSDGINLLYDYCHYHPTGSAVVGDAIAGFLHVELVSTN